MVTALALEVGVCAFNTSWVIPKTLKMVSVATWCSAFDCLLFSKNNNLSDRNTVNMSRLWLVADSVVLSLGSGHSDGGDTLSRG